MTLLIASCLAIVPGWLFRSHYYIYLLPVASLLAGLCLAQARRLAWIVIAVAAMIWPAYDLARFYWPLTAPQLMNALYSDPFFNDAPQIGRYLAEHSEPGDPIGVIGSEPELCFYARRRSASGHIYMYPLVESQKYAAVMQRELISDIETAKPLYMVYLGDDPSWVNHAVTPTILFDWIRPYLAEHYFQVGRIEYFSDKPARIVWDSDVSEVPPISDRWTGIYRRKLGH